MTIKIFHRFAAFLTSFCILVISALSETAAMPAVETPQPVTPETIVATILPQADDINQESATQAARSLLTETLGISVRLLTGETFLLREGEADEPSRVAVVTFTSDEYSSVFTVLLDAKSGEPIRASEFDAQCLTTLLYEGERLAKTPTEDIAAADAYPFPAFLANPSGKAVNITQMPTDYEIPMGVYMNGTPAIVTGMLSPEGESILPEQAQAGWVRVTVGMQGDFNGISGFVPATMISRVLSSTADVLPQGALTTESATGHLSLFKAGNRSSDILGVYRAGTMAQVLGRLRDWYHVRLGSLTGFVEVDNLAFDAQADALLKSVLPDAFDSVQPGVEDRYQKYMTAVDELWYKFGDSNDWPLAIKAQYSQLSLDWGFQDGPVNILPGEGDLTEDEAKALAQDAVAKEFGMNPSDYAKVNVRYAYPPESPDKPVWTFRYYSMVPGKPDCTVTLDRQGKAIAFWQDDTQAQSGAYALLSDLYLYQTGVAAEETAADLNRDKAAEIALQVYTEQTGENTDTVLINAALNANDTDRWWYVTFGQPETASLYTFDVAVLSPGGQVAAHTAREEYVQRAEDAWMSVDLESLEKEHGRLYTWSLEEKQKYAPGLWGLPGADDLTQEQALAIATSCLVDRYHMQGSELANWKPYFRFDISGKPVWVVEFFTEEIIASDVLTGYTVTIDAKTGEILESWSPEEQNG